MVRVMATGVFDLLHPGHVYFLTESHKLGDELVVVVARDQTVRRLKHEPYVPEQIRREMVEALKPVDKAVLGSKTDIYQTVVELKPDIITLGYNQAWNEQEIERECARRGVPVKVVRIGALPHDGLATRKIVERILERSGRKEASA
ncbi:MAG: FAD synthase [Thermoplasmatales archaeon]|jgi:FAD synthetase|nr:FAD synthase [Candidatus Thermoplasmatota archaeon]MCL5983811.1 FAD synthase [Candidatus Thermoplasmatota archaeon]MCW6168026.1 FAD synthase [Thermoplasmatales archaeon]